MMAGSPGASRVSVVLRFDPMRLPELRIVLKAGDFRFEERPHALFLARREGVTLTAYASGKLLVTGPQAEEYAGVLAGKGLAHRESPEVPAPKPVPPGALVLNFDGLCEPKNPGGVAAWGYLVRRDGRVVHEASGLAAPPGPGATNNVAEYAALIEGLRWLAANHQDADIVVRGDSKLIVSQASGRWRRRGCAS